MKITPKEGSGTFLVRVSDNDDCHSTAQYSVVKFTPELLEQIKLFKKIIEGIKEQGKSIHQMTSFEYSAKYFSECSYDGIENIDDDVADALYESMKHNTQGSVEINPIDTKEIPMLRTEGDQLIVDDCGVMFDAYVKHTDTRMWTEKISFEQLGL